MQLHMTRTTYALGPLYRLTMGNDRVTAAKSEAIAAVSRWRDAVQASKFESAKDWADAASVSASTITRGMKPNAESTTKIENLHLLAQAAKLPSVLDFLEAQARGIDVTPPQQQLPPSDILAAIVDEIVAEVGAGRIPASKLRPAGRFLELALRLVSENPANRSTPDVARAVARTIIAQPLPSMPEA